VADARVLVAGASGFAGALAAQLVWSHPRLELASATSRSDAGTRLDHLYPRYRVPLELTEFDDATECDAAIVAYPHGAAAPVVAALRERGVPVVDLSADFRLGDGATYEQWYGAHGAPELRGESVYGLTELNRDAIRGATLVANPGCYPTASVLALAPLARAGLIEDVVIDAKSGVSGAGRGGGDRLHFVSVDENLAPYGTGGHRHQPEIAEQLALLGSEPTLTFVPHLVPLDQGELVSCYVRPSREISADELAGLYEDAYAAEPFVEVVDRAPGMREVRDTNLCRIHVTTDRSGRVIVFGAIDNLWKGAAGQAIQNLNLMLGFDEGEGL
jgi:N-acetyl-gamma-glutamyl-phosphate reductase